MSWLIGEKMFTHFYNKFRPVNCMYYIKCGVNSLLHNSGCCIRSVAPWMTGLSWHSIHKEGDILQIYFCVIFHETRHHAQAHVTFGALIRSAPIFGCEKNTDNSAVGLMISLASVCYGDFCWGLLLLLLLLLFLFFFFFLKIVFNITSLSIWVRVSVSNQSFTDSFLLKFHIFSWPWLRPTIVFLVYTMYDWPKLQKPYAAKDMNAFCKTDLKV